MGRFSSSVLWLRLLSVLLLLSGPLFAQRRGGIGHVGVSPPTNKSAKHDTIKIDYQKVGPKGRVHKDVVFFKTGLIQAPAKKPRTREQVFEAILHKLKQYAAAINKGSVDRRRGATEYAGGLGAEVTGITTKTPELRIFSKDGDQVAGVVKVTIDNDSKQRSVLTKVRYPLVAMSATQAVGTDIQASRSVRSRVPTWAYVGRLQFHGKSLTGLEEDQSTPAVANVSLAVEGRSVFNKDYPTAPYKQFGAMAPQVLLFVMSMELRQAATVRKLPVQVSFQRSTNQLVVYFGNQEGTLGGGATDAAIRTTSSTGEELLK